MPMNVTYHGPGDLADVIPVFPLAGALLLVMVLILLRSDDRGRIVGVARRHEIR